MMVHRSVAFAGRTGMVVLQWEMKNKETRTNPRAPGAGSHGHPDRRANSSGVLSDSTVQLAYFSNISHHVTILLEVRAGTHLRHQGWGYVKGRAPALCRIQSRPRVSLLRPVRRSLPCLRRFPLPSYFSMIAIPLCMPMRKRRSSPEPHDRSYMGTPSGAPLHTWLAPNSTKPCS